MHTVIIKLVMQLKKTNVTYLVGFELRKQEEN